MCCVSYTYGPSQLALATFQVLKSHMWLTVPILDSADLDLFKAVETI